MVFKIILSSLIFALFTSCAPTTKVDTDNEHIIGNRLENVAAMKSTDGSEKNKIAIFDETIKKVHEFDLDTMKCTRTFKVLQPDEKHYVVNDPNGNYIVDFSTKHISIFDKNSNIQDDVVKFIGKPVSAAFRPELGLLVMYDDLRNVSILKMLPDGHVVQAETFGSVVGDEESISSGDLLEDGRLVLALSDNSLVIVDVQQSLNQGQFVYTKQVTTLNKISWISPVPNKNNVILVKADDQAALYNINSASIVASMNVNVIEKYSKSSYPHMIDRVDPKTARLIYTDGVSIKSVTLQNQMTAIANSDLDMNDQTWTSVELLTYTGFSLFNDVNQVREKRFLKRFKLPNMLAVQSKALPDKTQIKLGRDYFFALYPSELGYAEKTSVVDDASFVIKQFNLKEF